MAIVMATGILWGGSNAAASEQKASLAESIINGLPATGHGQPWMVALVRNTTRTDVPLRKRQFCGGTLIDPQWVVTAAHCVVARSVTDMSLVLGESNLDSPGAQPVSISQIVIHPEYNPRTFANDIAMLRLSLPSTLTPLERYRDVSEIAPTGTQATIYGWGVTYINNEKCKPLFTSSSVDLQEFECKIFDLDPGSRPSQNTLLQSNITLLSDADCTARIQELLNFMTGATNANTNNSADPPLVRSQICGYDPIERRGVCFGDSGGPLVLEQNGKLFHAGITSVTYNPGGCERKLATDVFTKTAFYSAFIDDVLQRDPEYSFERFCPPVLQPQVAYLPTLQGSSEVRLYWDAVPHAKRYTLRYSTYPDAGAVIDATELAGSVTEVTAILQAGSSFYVTLQAHNANCSGASSSPLIVKVPQ